MSTEAVVWILAAGFATSLGGLALLVIGDVTPRGLDVLLGFTAGVMLAATAFSLLVPALELGDLWQVLVGFGAGGAVLALADRTIPHLHLRFFEKRRDAASYGSAHRAGLLVSALTIHNVPEGMAVGVAFAAGAMLYVVVDELIPESHARGNERAATLALLAGFALMMGLDNAFG